MWAVKGLAAAVDEGEIVLATRSVCDVMMILISHDDGWLL